MIQMEEPLISDSEEIISASEQETIALGKQFASRLQPGDVIALYGELGAGKTEFVKGICSYFDVEEIVTSPTFTIINHYHGTDPNSDEEVKIYHVDLYRIESASDLREIGLAECMHSTDAIKLVEWANKARSVLPDGTYSISFGFDESNEDLRVISIKH